MGEVACPEEAVGGRGGERARGGEAPRGSPPRHRGRGVDERNGAWAVGEGGCGSRPTAGGRRTRGCGGGWRWPTSSPFGFSARTSEQSRPLDGARAAQIATRPASARRGRFALRGARAPRARGHAGDLRATLASAARECAALVTSICHGAGVPRASAQRLWRAPPSDGSAASPATVATRKIARLPRNHRQGYASRTLQALLRSRVCALRHARENSTEEHTQK